MKQLLTVSLIFLAFGLFAQPVNDDCAGIVELGPAPSCDSTLYNNVNATESNIGFDNIPNCFVGGTPSRDVWFSFIAVDTILDYRITLTGCPDPSIGAGSIINPQIAVYRGDCEFDGLVLLECISAGAGETILDLDLFNLTPGVPYFLRINDWSSSATPNSGAFKLCVTKKPPISTIDQGGSTACSGTLTDTGGPDEDYGNNENFTYTICPTAPHNCINFSMEYYNLESGDFFTPGDQMVFYDGPNINSPIIGTLEGSGSSNPSFGGVCYSVSASSGCLTIQFTSNTAVAFEGFSGYWECTAEACQTPETIEVDVSATPTEIVESIVSGQTTVTITDINCGDIAIGTFLAGDDTNLGMEKGMLMTSGSAASVANPGTFFSSAFSGGTNDPDLDYLSQINGNNSISQDACVVEMDVFAATDEITFEYIFGSEEYPEWVNTTFNDIFAFLVSGPGIVGDPNIGNQLNIATLPDGTFIQINSVNDGSNWEYYRNNLDGPSVSYDGLTSDSLGIKKSLTARIPTIPCNNYHLKFAVADRGDSSFDSGVFISDIKGGSPNLGINYQNGIQYLVEDCTVLPDEVVISLNAPVTNPTTYSVVIGGNAVPGVDYELDIPSEITFNTGQEVFTFPITPLSDLIPEGIDTVLIQLVRDFGCGAVVLATLVVEIHDDLQVEIFDNEADTVLVCQGSCTQLEANGAATYFWQPAGLLSDPQISNPTACPDDNQWVMVTGTLGICVDVDSVFLQLIDPMVNILPDVDNINLCTGDSVTLTAVNNINDNNLQWESFFINIPDPSNPVQVVVPPPFFNSIQMTVEVELGGCVATDFININIDPFDFPTLQADTTICQNYSVDLGEDIQFTTTSFNWTPNVALVPGNNVSGPVATPDVTTTYTLIASSPTGICKDTAEVTITVIPAEVEILNPDTTFICLGDTVLLTNVNSTNGIGVTWSPQTNAIPLSPQQMQVFPDESTWYYATLVTAACTVVDSVLVYVDSLPDLSIMAIPDKESYCQGEQITLVSPTYEPANFPGIDLLWNDPVGALTPDSFLNLVFNAIETHVYVRTTTVNACVSHDSIEIIVTPVSAIEIVPGLDTICPGESVVLTVTGPGALEEISWSPPTGLSCTDCISPTASPQSTTTYSVEAEFEGCPVGASATLIVPSGGLFDLADGFVCPGDPFVLNSVNNPAGTYSWTSSDGSLTTTNPTPTVNPTATTTYFVTASLAECPPVSGQVTVTVGQDFTVTVAQPGILCPGDEVVLEAIASAPSLNFVWEDAAGTQVGTGQTISVSPAATTSYTVFATDPQNCFNNEATVTVEVSLPFTVDAKPDTTVSAGSPVTLVATSSIPGISFEWLEGTAMIGSGDEITVTSCVTTIYTLVGTDAAGCESTDQVNVTVTAGFKIDSITVIQVDSTLSDSLYEGEEFFLTVQTTPAVLPGATYEWYIDGVLVSTTNDTISESLFASEILGEDIEGSITQAVNVVITSDAGCEAEKNREITVFNIPIQMPNAFSPNGDGTNDNYLIFSKIPLTILEFKVWNRWGQLVYDNEGGETGWDGKHKSEDAASDVYVYRIKYEITGGSGKQYVQSGDVTLLR